MQARALRRLGASGHTRAQLCVENESAPPECTGTVAHNSFLLFKRRAEVGMIANCMVRQSVERASLF
jgi:hypothetical protein